MTRCYAWPLTVTAGACLQLHVSTELDAFGVRLFRSGARVEEVGNGPTAYPGHLLPLGRPDEAWGWPRVSIPLGEEIADGIYVAVPVPVGADGNLEPVEADQTVLTRPDACLFVLQRRAGADRPSVLFKLPTATYTAYNQLGGVSLYAGVHWRRDWTGPGYVASLQRPGNGGIGGRVMDGDAPDAYHRSSRRQTYAHWDAPFVAWLEEHDYDVAYCTDFDLHSDPSVLDGVTLLLSCGHDEYWSTEMRRRVLEFVDQGGNMCFFAGDVACFVIEIAESGDRLFCRKMEGSPGAYSRVPGAIWHLDDPEDWLTMSSGAYGGGWWDGLRAVDGYKPVVPQHWAFDGVDFPPEGITGGAASPVIGYETDGVALERASDPPRLSEQRKGGEGRVLLALAKLSAGWVAGREEANAAIMIRTALSGGMVFSTGTTDWPLALATDAAVSRITENVVARLARRPLRIHGPVCPEDEYVGEGSVVGPDRDVTWYLDGTQSSVAGFTAVDWTVHGGERAGSEHDGHLVTRSAEGEDWLTVTATATDAGGAEYFGSQTVRVLSTEEYLRRRIVRELDAMAFPDEQGGALVDQHASEGALAERVIPIRIGWVQRHARELERLMAELEGIWVSSGRMDEGALRDDER